MEYSTFNEAKEKAMLELNLIPETETFEESGCILSDGGSCTGHWYEYIYQVKGTAGNLIKYKYVKFYSDNGYVMYGNRTGELNPNPVWDYVWGDYEMDQD